MATMDELQYANTYPQSISLTSSPSNWTGATYNELPNFSSAPTQLPPWSDDVFADPLMDMAYGYVWGNSVIALVLPSGQLLSFLIHDAYPTFFGDGLLEEISSSDIKAEFEEFLYV